MSFTKPEYDGRLCRRRNLTLLLAALALGAAATANADTFRIEIDYMVGPDHSHEPSATVIAAVQQMFRPVADIH